MTDTAHHQVAKFAAPADLSHRPLPARYPVLRPPWSASPAWTAHFSPGTSRSRSNSRTWDTSPKSARTQPVRDLGRYLVERHQQMQQRLQQVADQLDVILSYKLSEVHLRIQRHYAAISSASFDTAFVRHEIGDYRYFLTHFRGTAASGTGLVKAYAASEIPQLKEDQSKIVALPH